MSLSNKIWRTRQARIRTSERLKTNDFFSQIILSYYTLFIIGISIMLTDEDEKLILVFSIIVFATSIFVLAMNFKERAKLFQTSYIKMDELCSCAEAYEKGVQNDDTKVKLKQVQAEYHFILNITENHSTYDDLKVQCDIRNEDKEKYDNPDFTIFKWIKLIGYLIFQFSFKLVLLILPICLLQYMI
ncbi:MAG: SLATT domain-containing protein [Sulfurimonadaceae bacterium]